MDNFVQNNNIAVVDSSRSVMAYFEYLVPSDPDKGIQWIFLIVIFSLCLGTIVWVKRTANKDRWLARWENETKEKKEDDFDVEHGSVLELSEAVATPAERFADILPSMLLVVGLLGTFLGVGVALGAAAEILNDKGADPEVLLGKMMPMLGGLGALFKSSIYGIIFFFLFTFWKSKFGTNDKRFRWCVEKCNAFLQKKREDAQKNTADIINTLNGMSQSIGDSLGDCIRDSLQTALVEGFKGVQKNLVDMNSNLCKTLEDTVVARFRALEGNLKLLVKESGQSVEKMTSISNDMNGMMLSMDGLATSMKNEFTHVAKSAKLMGAAAQNLSNSVDAFEPSVRATLEKIQTEFVASIDKSTGVMGEAGASIRGAVTAMAQESHKSQEKINETLEKFKNDIKVILNDVKNATTAVQEISGITQESMSSLNEGIQSKLDSISRANLKIDAGMKKLPESLSASIANSLAPIQESIEKGTLKIIDGLAKTPDSESTVAKNTGKKAAKI